MTTEEAQKTTEEEKKAEEIQTAIDKLMDDPQLLDIDPNEADLTLPHAYETDMWAGERLAHVRRTQALRLQVVANRVANPDRAKEIEREANVAAWLVQAITVKYPESEQRSREFAAIQAHNAEQERVQALKVIRRKGGDEE